MSSSFHLRLVWDVRHFIKNHWEIAHLNPFLHEKSYPEWLPKLSNIYYYWVLWHRLHFRTNIVPSHHCHLRHYINLFYRRSPRLIGCHLAAATGPLACYPGLDASRIRAIPPVRKPNQIICRLEHQILFTKRRRQLLLHLLPALVRRKPTRHTSYFSNRIVPSLPPPLLPQPLSIC
jgi:hypothetical protein